MEELLLFASELRTRAQEILARAGNTDDVEAQKIMQEIAASYQKLALKVEQRVRRAHQRVAASPLQPVL